MPLDLTLEELDTRLRTVLPVEYQESYTDLELTPMGSAALKYSADGRVAWDEIWGSFCDLAMAGGPPHKGALLEPGLLTEVDADRLRYDDVVAEICRGIAMTTGLEAVPSASAGWVSVACDDATSAGWLMRAIVMENVAVRAEGSTLDLPASPAFRLEKEVKNVITVTAKTYHYWDGHMPYPQQWAIRRLFDRLAAECPLVVPEPPTEGGRSAPHALFVDDLAKRIRQEVGLAASAHQYVGWLGLQCAAVADAIWMMRALVVCNVLARREGTVLFVPVNPSVDPGGLRMLHALGMVHRLWSRERRG